MDLWVVAAAAGAGYLAKHLSLDREGESESQSSFGGSTHDKSEPRPLLQQLQEQACPLQRFSWKQLGGSGTSDREEVSSDFYSRLSEANGSAGASATEVASTSGFSDEVSVNLRVYEEFNILSLSSFPPGLSGNNNHQEKADGIKGKSEIYDKPGDFLSHEPSTGERGFHYKYGRGRSRSFLRSKLPRGYSIKPFSSLESCLIAQLYKEHGKMDKNVFTPPSSPTTVPLRPLIVTDGKQIISRASSDSYRVRFGSVENKVHRGDEYAEGETVLGVPPLPETGSLELPKKLKQKRGKGSLGRSKSSNMRVSPKDFQSQGSPNGMLLFCIGIAIGVMSTVMANKREVDKLNELLKQTENLVQDLQEELEMKDSLTVRELPNEGYESLRNNDLSIHHQPLAPFSPQRKRTELKNCDSKELYDQKEDGKSESLSKIEAELEAELEMLELNMSSSSVHSLFELDRHFGTEIVQGELRANMIKRGDRGQDDSDQDVSGTSTTRAHTANYSVSPQELSLRLREVIQARLEERITELETALQHSRQRMPLVESEGFDSWRNFSNSEISSSSTHGSPIMMMDYGDNIAGPLVLNLSGEALDAYNEACEELTRISEAEEEYPPSTISNNKNIYQEGLHPVNDSQFCHQNGGGQNGSLTHLKVIEERQSRTLVHDKFRLCEEQVSRSQGSSEGGQIEDEEDEMGKLLIKQIVEKAKQRSPAVLKVQKMLFSMDEKTSFK
ncbi:hypothetical protein NE237_020973 [Protea cynaroides]|uniref:Uncharacterized protein n=1 Tax=Protea cynaroides TaxID=273540 RepID=A0A9Q0H7M5_9MAGN|nr:hypothetical protein NE237_020973 [Protea cynaroides]